MAAIDFPSAPTDGQTFVASNGAVYVYKAAQTLWMPSPQNIGVAPQLRLEDTSYLSCATATAVSAGHVPLITEGNRVFFANYTANNPNNKIRVHFQSNVGAAAVVWATAALFIDGGACSRSNSQVIPNANWACWLTLDWEGVLAPGAHTFELRLGGNTTAVGINSNGQQYGGGTLMTFMTVEEVGQGARGPSGPPGSGQLLQTVRSDTATIVALPGAPTMPVANRPTTANGMALYGPLNITPISATSRLRVRAQVLYSADQNDVYSLALFRDSGVNAIAASFNWVGAANVPGFLEMELVTPANAVTPTAFTWRVGANSTSGTFWMNGSSASAQYFGGYANSFFQIEEIV